MMQPIKSYATSEYPRTHTPRGIHAYRGGYMPTAALHIAALYAAGAGILYLLAVLTW